MNEPGEKGRVYARTSNIFLYHRVCVCLCVHFIGAYESETVRFKFLSEREMLSQKSLAVTSFAHITSKKTHEKQKRSIIAYDNNKFGHAKFT